MCFFLSKMNPVNAGQKVSKVTTSSCNLMRCGKKGKEKVTIERVLKIQTLRHRETETQRHREYNSVYIVIPGVLYVPVQFIRAAPG